MVSLRLGLVGRGYWSGVYARTLDELGVSYWHKGRDWGLDADGLIVASSTDSHYEVACRALANGVPVLVEKPVCKTASEARNLALLGGIAYAGHTRLFDPFWREFRASVGVPERVEAWAGGVNETNPDAELNWLAHLVPMCLDLGFDPTQARFHISQEKIPLRFVADGRVFTDSHGGVANLVRSFIAAIERGEPDNAGLRLGLKSLEYMESKCRSLTIPA